MPQIETYSDPRNAAERPGQRGSNGLSAKTVTGSPTTGYRVNGQTFTTIEAQAHATPTEPAAPNMAVGTKMPGL